MTTVFFGARWDAPLVDDAVQVATPVGELCLHCGEPVAAGDRGLIRVAVREVDGEVRGKPEPIHAECDLIGVMGHDMGVCDCTGYDTSSRAAARLVWERVGRERGRDLVVRSRPADGDRETSAVQGVEVQIYAVGWLAAVLSAWRLLTAPDEFGVYHRRFWWRNLRRTWRYCLWQARRGNWRAVRMTFNGYLCEPAPFPAGLKRCGSGWTRARARASLDRELRKTSPLGRHRTR